MKKILSVLLLTVLLLADQNNTNQIEQNLTQKIEPLKNENKLPKVINNKLQTDFKETNKENSENNIINAVIKIFESNPMIYSFIVTILVVGSGTLITLRNINKKTEESINAFEKSLEVQKELKQKEIIADNRQKWINDLRIEVSKYIRIINTLHNLKLQQEIEKDDEKKLNHTVGQLKENQDLTEVETKIALLLNPKEKNHDELYGNLLKYKSFIFNSKNTNQEYYDNYIDYMNMITNLTRAIIKEEWEKIKE